jgi:hypothetical protein
MLPMDPTSVEFGDSSWLFLGIGFFLIPIWHFSI